MTRTTALAVLALVPLLAATGCNATKRELTVVFSPTATAAEHAAALRACSHAAPHTTPEPQPTSTHHYAGSDVRFRIDSANDRDIAHLEACLQKQPGVAGFQDSSDAT